MQKLENKTLLDAVNRQQSDTGKLMFHTDSVQYTAKVFRNKLALLNITQALVVEETVGMERLLIS
jgi:hypothetical protein